MANEQYGFSAGTQTVKTDRTMFNSCGKYKPSHGSELRAFRQLLPVARPGRPDLTADRLSTFRLTVSFARADPHNRILT